VKHRVVGLARRIFNSGKNIFSLQEGVISKNFFERSTARQEIQHVGNTETKTPNAGAASTLAFFHRYSLQPFDAHKLAVYDGLDQRARTRQPRGHEESRPCRTNAKLARPWRGQDAGATHIVVTSFSPGVATPPRLPPAQERPPLAESDA